MHFGAPALCALALAFVLVHRSDHLPAWLCAAFAAGTAAGWIARNAETGRCAARLGPGPVSLTVHLTEPAGIDDGRVAVQVPSCGSDVVLARWPRRARDAAGTDASVTGEWLPREEQGRPAGTLVVRDIVRHGTSPSFGEHLRDASTNAAQRLFGARGPLVDVLVSGRRSALDPALTDAFAASGLVHLLSISGFHVGVIIAWLVLLLRSAGVARQRALVASAVVATLYVMWLGWPAPAARACGLAWLVTIGRLRQRNATATSILGVSCLIVVIVDPWAVRSLGAWLSAASLWGAMSFVRWSDRVFGEGWGWRTFWSSVGATLTTAPITAATLGAVAPVGIVLNFVAIPVAALAVPAAVLALLFASVAPIANAFAAGAGVALASLERIARFGAQVPYGHAIVPAGLRAAAPWAALLLGCFWVAHGRARRPLVLLRGAVLLAVASWCSAAMAGWGGGPHDGVTLALHLLDVGQGDAAVIRTPHGRWAVIDAGPRDDRSDAGERVVVPFLRRQGAATIDLFALSHAHADHVGGAVALFDRFDVREALDPGEPWADPMYGGFLAAVAAEGAAWYAVRDGAHAELDGVRFTVLHPDTAWAEFGLDLNEDSAVILVEYGRFRALFSGDAGLVAEERLRGRIGRVQLLKVGHHGSRTATGDAWLDELAPSAAVISVGRGNRYGHPAPATMTRLDAHHVPVFRTDLDGTITVTTDGQGMRVTSRRPTLSVSPLP